MAIRIQLRRDTAANWTSSNPVLRAGELGIETDTLKFKIGNGSSTWTQITNYANVTDTGLSNSLNGYILAATKGTPGGPAALDSNGNLLIPENSVILWNDADYDYTTTVTATQPTADRTITFPNATGTVVLKDSTDTLTNKTITSPTISGLYLSDSSVVFEGTANDHETTLQVTDPTADRTITFPDATGTVALTSDIAVTASSTNTFTNKSISLTTNTVTGTKAEFNSAMSDADFATISGSETLTNKTLTTPVISSITNGAATLTLPTSTGTVALTTDIPAGVVTESGTQTLTNKTLTSPAVSGLQILDGSIIVEGSTADTFETTVVFTDPTADRTITFQDVTGTVALLGDISAATGGSVSETGVQTLTNKTLTSPLISGLTITDGSIIVEGATADIHETTLSFTDPTADRTITFPNASGTVAFTSDLSPYAPLAGATFTGAVSGTDLTLSGNLTINGTTTNINSTNLVVEDKNIVIGDTATPSDTTADGGGITLKGLTDKTFNWVDSSDSWTSSENIDLATGKTFKINNTNVLTSSAVLGKSVPSGDIVGTSDTQTLTNKTFTSPKINEDVVITATATELNYVDGVTSAIQTQLDSRVNIADPAIDYYITNSGSGAYLVNGVSNGTLYFEKGKKYRVHVNATGHPFWIQTSSGAYNSGSVYSTGITNNGTQSGHIIVELASNAPQLYYACQYHSSMAGSIVTGTTFATHKALSDLSNVDNTSDANKPISTATQTALDLKASLSSPVFTGNITVPTAITFEGATDDSYETILSITDPTSDRVILFPDLTGTVVTSGDTGTVTNLMLAGSIDWTKLGISSTVSSTEIGYVAGVTSAIQTQLDGKVDESLFDAKGDLLVASADNTPTKLSVGTNGYLLTANSSATNGVEWAAAPVSLPSQTGNSGYYLTTNGTSASWGALVVPITTGTSTVSANTITTIDTTALSAFTSIEYMVSLKQGSKVRTSKVVVQTDGTSVDMTEFAITETGGTITGVVVSTAVSSTNAVLQLTATDAATTNVTVKFSKVAL